MIRPTYAIKLARIKLRSKRGMLFASVVVASLLFAALIALVIVFTGAEKSATEFVKKSGNNRYLVKAWSNVPYSAIDMKVDPSVEEVRAIKAFEKSYYNNIRSKYKALGLSYDASNEVPALLPNAAASTTLPEEQRVQVNWQSPVIEAMRKQKFEAYAATATNKLSDLKKLASTYGATGYYKVDALSFIPATPDMRLIKDGKEDFSTTEPTTGDASTYGWYTHAIQNGSYTFTDQKLLGRYLLTANTSALKGIPVIVTAQEAVSLFGKEAGIGDEPEATSEKLAWIKAVQTKLNGKTYQACYRNSTEQTLLNKIQRDYADMKNNESTKGYQKPHLIYAYPTTACGDITVQADTRSAAEKQADAKAEDTQKKLGTYVAPEHQLLTFQIVGFEYAQKYSDYSQSASAYISNLVAPQNLSMSLNIPIQMYQALPSKLRADAVMREYRERTPVYASADDDFSSHILEFMSIDKARAFLKNETCTSMNQEHCTKKYIADPYGSNYLILDEIGKFFNRIAMIAFPILLGLATIIIWFTISRIMAENRKETAVYRAMGAKRRDVTSIYVTYVLLVALRIAIVSSVLGVATALVVDHFYGNALTETAVAAFGIIDGAPTFSLFSLGSPLLAVVVLSIFVVSLIASIQPLIRNVRRSPIRDMREE